MTAPVPFEARVRPLIAAATPAPWAWDAPANWHGVALRIAPAEDMGKIIATIDTGWGKRTREANAGLIRAAVNTAAACADLAEAVRALRHYDDPTVLLKASELAPVLAALSRLDAAGSA